MKFNKLNPIRTQRTYFLSCLLIILSLFISTSCYASCYDVSGEASHFISSFVNHYESSPEGRYTHEYHPFLLKRTAQSLNDLTARLKSEGLNIAGRMIILGYEENAVPSYYTNFTRPKIDDESTLKINTGWAPALHNQFGFMTAFLFKDINALSEKFFKGSDSVFDSVPFEHLDVDTIPIFDDRASIFQEHAFGESLGLINSFYDLIVKKYLNKDHFGILDDLIKFWDIVYRNSLKTGSKQISGTQDILFSVEYARGLRISGIPMLKFFVGPDMTYPIEISCKQAKGVTLHAQKFVKKMTANLVPRNGNKTVYIFCSFVDGVGKSTMLGNIKNWMKHGEDVDSFEHVDNTSSQLADIFEYNKDVFIADLPAQISHFTYKPDGFVYTAVENELKNEEIRELKAYVELNKDKFIEDYKALVKNVGEIIKTQGFFADQLNDINVPGNWFIKNIYLLKLLKDNKYVPFSKDGVNYLFNMQQTYEIRLLKTLKDVRSEGLKNVKAEQMLFNLGVRLPEPFEYFLSDLVSRLKKQGVQEVVFVDFLSMYPRSSRENLRVNYLLQQLALLNTDFDTKLSFYRNFSNGGGELLSCLTNPKNCVLFRDALVDEALLRFALYQLIQEYKFSNLSGVSLQEITNIIQQQFQNKKTLPYFDFLRDSVNKKIVFETENLQRVYGFSKSFVNIQQLSFKRLVAFSQLIKEFFENNVISERLTELWSNCESLVATDGQVLHDSGDCDLLFKTSSGYMVHAIYAFDPACKSELVLAPFLRVVRENWYAVLSNILQAKKNESNKIVIEKEFIRVLPYFLEYDKNGNVYLLHQALPAYFESNFEPNDFKNLKTFNQPKLPQQNKCVEFGGQPYLASLRAVPTNCGVFAFDCNLLNLKNKVYDGSCVGYFVQKYQVDNDYSIIPTSKLEVDMAKDKYWEWCFNWVFKDAEKNGEYKPDELLFVDPKLPPQQNQQQPEAQSFYQPSTKSENIVCRAKKVYLGRKDQRSVARIFIRLIATLEMILKDPEADVAIRFGNHEDFRSAIKLLESVTVPNYFGIIFKQKLFKDYDRVEPYPSWAFWENLG